MTTKIVLGRLKGVEQRAPWQTLASESNPIAARHQTSSTWRKPTGDDRFSTPSLCSPLAFNASILAGHRSMPNTLNRSPRQTRRLGRRAKKTQQTLGFFNYSLLESV